METERRNIMETADGVKLKVTKSGGRTNVEIVFLYIPEHN